MCARAPARMARGRRLVATGSLGGLRCDVRRVKSRVLCPPPPVSVLGAHPARRHQESGGSVNSSYSYPRSLVTRCIWSIRVPPAQTRTPSNTSRWPSTWPT